MDGLLILFLLIALIYFTILHFTFWGLKKLPLKEQSAFPQVSVVIAAHNEAQRIRPTLRSLEKLSYPADRYEIILVDDASDDDTASVIEAFCQKHENWKLIRLNSRDDFLSGKKRALKEGIARSRGEIIFTTDADCTVPPQWLTFMTAYFERDVDMVLGYSPLKRFKGWMNRILQFDNLFSAIVAAAPTTWGLALTSVGRNLAYRKETYRALGGFDALKKHRSGDDVYLTERFRKQAKGRIVFCRHPETFVETLPVTDFITFWHQQIRKNSKTLRKGFLNMVFSVGVFLVYVYLWIFPLFRPAFVELWMAVIGLKLLLEFLTLTLAARLFQRQWLVPWLPLFQLFYPLYITFFTILGAFQIYQWKK
ncbi:glycosyltransferase [Calditrichota bacterium LG25]